MVPVSQLVDAAEIQAEADPKAKRKAKKEDKEVRLACG